MPFSVLDRYYVKFNLDFLFFYFLLLKNVWTIWQDKHNIPWNKLCAVPSILHTVGVNWNSHSEIDTAYTGKCDVALNKVHVKTF
jgi:hypothetical protein